MSLKKDYVKSNCVKLIGGPGGWGCPCCNPYSRKTKNMKKLARRRLRHVSKLSYTCPMGAEE